MARMIDPSELDGDDLVNWYRRSPDEVEAEREAARQQQYDAFVKSIGGASEPSDDLAVESSGSSDGTVGDYSEGVGAGDEAGVAKARFLRPPAPSVMARPTGPQVGPPLDARGGPPIGPTKGGFFDSYPYLDTFQGYATGLPSPLNFVTATPTRWWMLGDGSLALPEEVERIHAEQQQRLKGQGGVEPAQGLRVVNKWADGQIPRADQVAKDERELDPTCAPNGGWERDPNFSRYSKRTQLYETQVTRAPGLDYVVRNPGERPVKFDGCAVWDPRHPLLEAKGPGYAPLLPKAAEWGFYGNMLKGAVDQAGRQVRAAPNQRIEWHVAEPGAVEFFEDATFPDQPPIVVRQTAAR